MPARRALNREIRARERDIPPGFALVLLPAPGAPPVEEGGLDVDLLRGFLVALPFVLPFSALGSAGGWPFAIDGVRARDVRRGGAGGGGAGAGVLDLLRSVRVGGGGAGGEVELEEAARALDPRRVRAGGRVGSSAGDGASASAECWECADGGSCAGGRIGEAEMGDASRCCVSDSSTAWDEVAERD